MRHGARFQCDDGFEYEIEASLGNSGAEKLRPRHGFVHHRFENLRQIGAR